LQKRKNADKHTPANVRTIKTHNQKDFLMMYPLIKNLTKINKDIATKYLSKTLCSANASKPCLPPSEVFISFHVNI